VKQNLKTLNKDMALFEEGFEFPSSLLKTNSKHYNKVEKSQARYVNGQLKH